MMEKETEQALSELSTVVDAAALVIMELKEQVRVANALLVEIWKSLDAERIVDRTEIKLHKYLKSNELI